MSEQFEDDRPSRIPATLAPGILFLIAALLSAYLCFAHPVIDTALYSLQQVMMGLGGNVCPLLVLNFAWFAVLLLRTAGGRRNGFLLTLGGTLAFPAIFGAVHMFSAEYISSQMSINTYANFLHKSFELRLGGGWLGGLLGYPLYSYIGKIPGVLACSALLIVGLTMTGIFRGLLRKAPAGEKPEPRRTVNPIDAPAQTGRGARATPQDVRALMKNSRDVRPDDARSAEAAPASRRNGRNAAPYGDAAPAKGRRRSAAPSAYEDRRSAVPADATAPAKGRRRNAAPSANATPADATPSASGSRRSAAPANAAAPANTAGRSGGKRKRSDANVVDPIGEAETSSSRIRRHVAPMDGSAVKLPTRRPPRTAHGEVDRPDESAAREAEAAQEGVINIPVEPLEGEAPRADAKRGSGKRVDPFAGETPRKAGADAKRGSATRVDPFADEPPRKVSTDAKGNNATRANPFADEAPRRGDAPREDDDSDELFEVVDETEDASFVPDNYDAPAPKPKRVEEGVRAADVGSAARKGRAESAPEAPKPSLDRRLRDLLRSQPEEEEEEAYNYPPIDLLAQGDSAQDVRSHKEADERKAEDLIYALHSYGIDMKLVGIAHGPSVTRFELQPPPGVKVSRITSLSDDIALHMAAETVRIEAPIPGKAAIGIEIPNEKRESVRLRDVLESQDAIRNPSRLAIGLGKDNGGRFVIADIAKMPHVLIAGQTGSGKSVCVNSIICSILMRATPDEVRMILIDPKVVELSVYNGIPHLIAPVVTDPKKAASALEWAVAEMSRRYKIFADRKVRDIKGFNKALEPGEKPMPQMVIIIDELADLMMVASKNVEESICRLAQLARACGMHLVIATQRPSVNVVTGIIKANIPSRIAFAVSSITDSRVMLDYGGAEKLLGNGDMLFVPPATSKSVRVQGSWISDEEVHAVVQFIQSRCDANYDEDVIEHIETAMMSDAEKEDHEADERGGKLDSKLREAIEVVVEAGQASVSMLQRRLRIGYARAGRIIDEMEQRGIISFADGSKPRNVLISREEMYKLFEEDGQE